jgi:hypothetical protein
MKHFKIILSLVLLFFSCEAFSQSTEEVEMADMLRKDGKIYTVVFSVVIILTAMIILLVRVDRKLFKMEAFLKKDEEKK